MKISKIIVCLLLVVSMLFALTACQPPQENCTQHVDQDNDGKCDLCDTTIEQSGDGEVTAEVWTQQLDFSSHTNIAIDMVGSYELNEQDVGEIMHQKVVGNQYYNKLYITRDGEQSYLSEKWYDFLADGSCVVYSRSDNGEVNAETYQNTTIEDATYWQMVSGVILDILKDNFANATYDAQTKKYTYVQTTTVECLDGDFVVNSSTCVLQFVNNKLVSIDIQAVGPAGYSYRDDLICDMHFVVTVGGQEIVLPTVATIE